MRSPLLKRRKASGESPPLGKPEKVSSWGGEAKPPCASQETYKDCVAWQIIAMLSLNAKKRLQRIILL